MKEIKNFTLNINNNEKIKLKSLLQFILDEIWVDSLDLMDFHPVVGIEKDHFLKIMNNYKFLDKEYLSCVNDLLVSIIYGYPFHKEYENKCNNIKEDCEFFLTKLKK